MRATVLAAAMAALVVVAAGAQPPDEGRPVIFLEKRVFAESSKGKKSFFELHVVEEGESLWKILERSPAFSRERYGAAVREFRRANPAIADPGRLRPGDRILVPSVPPVPPDPRVAEGKAVPYKVVRGDALIRILARRGVRSGEIRAQIEAVRELNPGIRDPDLILAGETILLPGAAYPGGPGVAGAPPAEVAASGEAVALSRAVPDPSGGAMPAGRPGATLGTSPGPGGPTGPSGSTAKPEDRSAVEPSPGPGGASLARPKSPYRGLLADLARGLGEQWIDRGTLYLPVGGGGEVVLNLEEYPVVRFGTGVNALLDFGGSLPPEVAGVLRETWPEYRVVDLSGGPGAADRIDRLLRASGYHSVKEGLTRPLVIGEGVAVTLPAEWIILKAEESLRDGEVILVKEVPERPGEELTAVLRYAGRVGIRVLPFAADPSAGEGFLAALEAGPGDPPAEGSSAGRNMPRGGLAALDFALEFLGLAASPGAPVTVASRGNYTLTVTPDRAFDAAGRRYLVDAGRMTPSLRGLLRDAGHPVFEVGPEEPGRSIVRRIIDAAEIDAEERKDVLLAGGAEEGFDIRATGLFVGSAPWLQARNLRAAAFVRGRVHASTRELLRDFRVEIAGW